jgi:hypothetical protein
MNGVHCETGPFTAEVFCRTEHAFNLSTQSHPWGINDHGFTAKIESNDQLYILLSHSKDKYFVSIISAPSRQISALQNNLYVEKY